jgi:CBS domain-containing protein
VAGNNLMTRPAVTIGRDASVAEAASLMSARRIKRLPVVDQAGQLIGVVSRVDVLSVFSRDDGEIRGEIVNGVIIGEFALNPEVFEVTVRSRDCDDHRSGREQRRSLGVAGRYTACRRHR